MVGQLSSDGSVGPGPPTDKVSTKMGRLNEQASAKRQREAKRLEKQRNKDAKRLEQQRDKEAKILERDARIESRRKTVQVLENLSHVLDEQEMQDRLGKVLLEKITDSVKGDLSGFILIHKQMMKNNNIETIFKVLKDFDFFDIKVKQSPNSIIDG